MAKIRFLNPATLAKPPGYTYAVDTVGAGRTVYIAGQLGLDLDNRIVGVPGDFRAQANKAFENLKAALAAAGARIEDVVKINNYLVNMDHIGIFRDVRDAHINTAKPPASTTVAISRLAREGALFEIEAIAFVPQRAAPSKAVGTRALSSRARRAKAASRGARGRAKAKAPPRKRK